MTTVSTPAWRHTEPDWIKDEHGSYYSKCGATMGTLVCGCSDIRPDRTSPCGYEQGIACGWPEDWVWHAEPVEGDQSHEYEPTRCKCGHGLEEVIQ